MIEAIRLYMHPVSRVQVTKGKCVFLLSLLRYNPQIADIHKADCFLRFRKSLVLAYAV